MPKSENKEARPHGIPLDAVIACLPKAAKARQQGDSLVVQHGNFATQLDITRPPANYKSESGPIKAVVQVRSHLPSAISTLFEHPEMTIAMNMFATVGALTVESGGVIVGSRVTLYEDDEQSWNIYLPLIVFALAGGTTSLLGAMRRSLSNERGQVGVSAWSEDDFELARKTLSQLCVCFSSGSGLTAEFGLHEGAMTAAAGHVTALFQMFNDQPHSDLGGGLFCLLQMPHTFKDEQTLDQALIELNRLEMKPHDLAPHFGAWCRNRSESASYVAFLPNSLYKRGIALNLASWARFRATRAAAMLQSLGASAPAG
jgi:hypothetical protein